MGNGPDDFHRHLGSALSGLSSLTRLPGLLDRFAINLKSFYASVECVEHKLNPMTINLVVADASRTTKTKVIQKVAEVNSQRQRSAPSRKLTGSSSSDPELKARPELALDYLTAPPRMAKYLEWSTRIYPEDIHVYSIDEVMMDVTDFIVSSRAVQ